MGQDAIDSLHDLLISNMVICSWSDSQVFLYDVKNEIETLSDNEFHIDLEIPSEIYKQIILHGKILDDDGEEVYRTTEIEFIRKKKAANNEKQSFRIPYSHDLNNI